MTKNTVVGIKELRLNLDKYVKEVGRGSSFTVVRRSKPLFRIAPVEEDNETGWVTLFDAGRDNRGKGIAGTEVLRILRRIKRDERPRKTAPKTR